MRPVLWDSNDNLLTDCQRQYPSFLQTAHGQVGMWGCAARGNLRPTPGHIPDLCPAAESTCRHASAQGSTSRTTGEGLQYGQAVEAVPPLLVRALAPAQVCGPGLLLPTRARGQARVCRPRPSPPHAAWTAAPSPPPSTG